MSELANPMFSRQLNRPSILIATPEDGVLTQMAYSIPFATLSQEKLEWRLVFEAHLQRSDLAGVDCLILCRCSNSATLSVVRFARHHGIKVLYELDDNLLEPPLDEEWGRRYSQSCRPRVIELLLDESDLIKAGSPELARRLLRRGYRAIYQPYAINLLPLQPERVTPPYRVGYFGTRHHRSDLNRIFPALLKVEETLGPKVEFQFIGCHPDRWEKLRHAKVQGPITDYQKFLTELASSGWTLGLAPLRPSSFNQAKSDSKFRDLSAAGVVGIYADVAPYRNTIRQGVNGWLCGDDPQEWYRTIMRSLASPHRRKMLENARAQLLERNHPTIIANQWLSLIQELFHV
jgi:glycosyltransferase involved in cell wall biosynthesis